MGEVAYIVRLEKEGYENVLAVTLTKPDTLFRKLFKKGTIPAGMVYVEGYREEEQGDFLKEKHGFFIDRYEVTNKQYKEFIDKGGYSNPEYWKNEFIKNGKVLTWKEAIAEFTDKTGGTGHQHGKQEIILKDRIIIRYPGLAGMKQQLMLNMQEKVCLLQITGVVVQDSIYRTLKLILVLK